MKKLSLILFLFAGLTLTSRAQQPAAAPAEGEKKAADNPNAPEMTFENETFDYGTIKQGADGGTEFKFKNTGVEPLVISEAHGSCGCTVPTWPKEPVLKGQTGTIKVHYDTNRIGAFTKTVTITTNGKTTTKVLTIKGVVEGTNEANEQGIPLKKTDGSPLEKK